MSTLSAPRAAVDRIRAEIDRTVLRARNGIKLAAGIGRPRVGVTPKDVVWRHGRAELWHYRSDQVRVGPPLLIVFSLITRSYVLDLTPGNSFVERLLAAGFDVYLLDWGTPDERDAANRLEDYVDAAIPAAIEQVRRRRDLAQQWSRRKGIRVKRARARLLRLRDDRPGRGRLRRRAGRAAHRPRPTRRARRAERRARVPGQRREQLRHGHHPARRRRHPDRLMASTPMSEPNETTIDVVRNATRELARKFDYAYWREKDKLGEYPWEFVKAFAQGGWLGALIPEEYGGLGVAESGVMMQEIAASGASASGASAVHFYLFPPAPIIRHGSAEMRREFLPKLARGGILMAFGVTEPTAGVDTSRITTRADKVDGGRSGTCPPGAGAPTLDLRGGGVEQVVDLAGEMALEAAHGLR
jgi:Acyl-CoA dehydrogenase, N-terminal domain/Poly-beta-hydroxybutyrate polymerase (PhaC) N-terminus